MFLLKSFYFENLDIILVLTIFFEIKTITLLQVVSFFKIQMDCLLNCMKIVYEKLKTQLLSLSDATRRYK